MLSGILDHLRSHVTHRPATLVGLRSYGIVEVEGEPEVDDEGLQIGQIDENILRL